MSYRANVHAALMAELTGRHTAAHLKRLSRLTACWLRAGGIPPHEVTCPTCGGCGHEGPFPVCCGRPSDGECCGDPEPDWRQCSRCAGAGQVLVGDGVPQ